MPDTLELSQELAAGKHFTREQAELVAKALAHTVETAAATKADLNELRMATKTDLNELRVATKTDLAGLRAEFKADLSASEVRLGHKFDQLKWVNVTALALFGSAAIKYLFKL